MIKHMRNTSLAAVSSLALVAVISPAMAQDNKPADVAAEQKSNQPNQPSAQQADGSANDAKQAKASTSAEMGMTDEVRLVSAAKLVGQPIRGLKDEKYADVEYLLIEPVSGKLVYYIVGSGELMDIGQDLVAVPQQAVRVERARDRQVEWTGSERETRLIYDADAKVMSGSPRIDRDSLADLTSPSFRTIVYKHWSAADPSLESGQDQASSKNGQMDESKSKTQNRMPSGDQQAASQANEGEMQRDAAGEQRSGEMADGSAKPGQANQGEDGQTFALVTTSAITTLVPPLLAKQSQLKGATVVSQDGEQLGDIESLVLDIDRGYVAFATIGMGGFLGIGGNEHPVPFQALNWRELQVFGIDMTADQLKEKKPSSDLLNQTSVEAGKLGELFESYEATPYWQEASSSGDAGSRSQGDEANKTPNN